MRGEKNGTLIKYVGSIIALLAVGVSVMAINFRIATGDKSFEEHQKEAAHATAEEHFRILDRMTWDQEERIRSLEKECWN